MSQFHAYENEAGSAAREWGVEPLAHLGFDDRRSNMRAYEAWSDMLSGRICPSIEDLEPAGVAGPYDIFLDLRGDAEDPELTCAGGALVAECGARGLKRLSDAPGGSFLGLLGAHYRYAALARHPIAFEGDRTEEDGRRSAYRAILLPFSSDGASVDFVQGRISWREPAGRDLTDEIHRQLEWAGTGDAGACYAPAWPKAPALELSAAD